MKPCLALFLASLLVLLSGCTAAGRTDPVSDSAVLVLEGSGTVVYADDAESTLTAEQERLLLSFFDRWYQSLAQLEAEDLSEFFCDSHQADYSAAALDLQVGIRQAQPLDYTLTHRAPQRPVLWSPLPPAAGAALPVPPPVPDSPAPRRCSPG